MEEISDTIFVREMRILWKNLDVRKRNYLGELIKDYFDGDRAEKMAGLNVDSVRRFCNGYTKARPRKLVQL